MKHEKITRDRASPASGWTPEHTRCFSTPVDPAFGFRRIAVRLTIPSVPAAARNASFAEHVLDPETRESTGQVIAIGKSGVLVSADNGGHWDFVELGLRGIDPVNCFTTAEGNHLIQDKAPRLEPGSGPSSEPKAVLRYSRDWQLLDEVHPGYSHWHGSRSIDQSAAGTIMYAEYPDNKDIYAIERAGGIDNVGFDVRPAHVMRSTDGGKSWQEVLRKDRHAIRHFHTLAADPFAPDTWWLSSGDRAHESIVWVSRDDGATWREAVDPKPAVDLHPKCAATPQSIYRYTDLVVERDHILWGTDDWLGGHKHLRDREAPLARRTGSRLYRAPKSDRLSPVELGYIGNPIRSIVDAGPVYFVLTEAKENDMTRPQVAIVSKTEPGLVREIFTIDVFRDSGTGFTYSRASRAARDGTFFTYRGAADLCELPLRIVRWDVEFF